MASGCVGLNGASFTPIFDSSTVTVVDEDVDELASSSLVVDVTVGVVVCEAALNRFVASVEL